MSMRPESREAGGGGEESLFLQPVSLESQVEDLPSSSAHLQPPPPSRSPSGASATVSGTSDPVCQGRPESP